jgi:hypothetical protein
MNIEGLHIGQRVKHPQHGTGAVVGLRRHSADIQFDDGVQRSVEPEVSGLESVEAQAELSGLTLPLDQFMRRTVEETVAALGLETPAEVVDLLGRRWQGGRLVLHPADTALQSKEVPLEIFFRKIVAVRNNLRVLEQKINGHAELSSAEKFDWQQYITRSYGSLTTFNVLFQHKEDQFRGGSS